MCLEFFSWASYRLTLNYLFNHHFFFFLIILLQDVQIFCLCLRKACPSDFKVLMLLCNIFHLLTCMQQLEGNIFPCINAMITCNLQDKCFIIYYLCLDRIACDGHNIPFRILYWPLSITKLYGPASTWSKIIVAISQPHQYFAVSYSHYKSTNPNQPFCFMS